MAPAAPSKPLTGCELAAVVMVGMLTLLGLSAFALEPRAGEPVAVFAPFMSADGVAGLVAAAGGALLAVGGRADVVIATAQEPGFSARLYAAGALLVLDARAAPWCRQPVTRRDKGLS